MFFLVMGRRFPTHENPIIHPAISLPFLALGMAATIAMITALCGRRGKSKPSSSSKSCRLKIAKKSVILPRTTTLRSPAPPSPPPAAEKVEIDYTTDSKELPLPPAMKQIGRSSSLQATKSASERKLKKSLSVNLPRSLSMARKEDHHQRNKEEWNPEDIIWKKTIILGEKCRVPEEEEDAIIHDGNGNIISAYHPRTPSALSLSRQCSFRLSTRYSSSSIDRDYVPVHEEQEVGTSRKDKSIPLFFSG